MSVLGEKQQNEGDDDETLSRVDQSIRILRHVIDQAGVTMSSGGASELAKAAAEVVPGAANIALAMRELLKQRLLAPTEVLLRAFLDRVGTLAFFRVRGLEGLEIWRNGWKFRKRPSLEEKLDLLPNEIFAHNTSADPQRRFSTEQLKRELKNLSDSMHSSVHGGPDSIDKTFVDRHGEFDLHVIGPDRVNTSFFETLCSLVVVSTMLLVFEIEAAFQTRAGKVMR